MDGFTVVLRPAEVNGHSCHESFGEISLQALEAPSFLLKVESALRMAGADLLQARDCSPDVVILLDTSWTLVLRKLQSEACLYPVAAGHVHQDTLP